MRSVIYVLGSSLFLSFSVLLKRLVNRKTTNKNQLFTTGMGKNASPACLLIIILGISIFWTKKIKADTIKAIPQKKTKCFIKYRSILLIPLK